MVVLSLSPIATVTGISVFTDRKFDQKVEFRAIRQTFMEASDGSKGSEDHRRRTGTYC